MHFCLGQMIRSHVFAEFQAITESLSLINSKKRIIKVLRVCCTMNWLLGMTSDGAKSWSLFRMSGTAVMTTGFESY